MSLLKRLEVPHEGGTIPDPWINNDIKPVEAGRRKWGFWTFNYYCTNDIDSTSFSLEIRSLTNTAFDLGVLINCNISTYMTGSSLIPLGLSWWQAIIAIVVGNILASMFIVLNSLPGAFYHCKSITGTLCLTRLWPDSVNNDHVVGFPVANRYVWGMWGSQWVVWNRIFLSISKFHLNPSLTLPYQC